MDYGEIYGRMHSNPKVFPGYSIKDHVTAIAALVEEIQPERMLDYGCGKGYQYLELRVHERWGGLLPHCYDPGVKQLRKKPEGRFQGVICTDVLEHIEESDIASVLSDIFERVDDGPAFVYFCIACRPAKRKRLPDGRDVHVTVRPPEWWAERLAPFERNDGLIIKAVYDEG